MSLFFLLAGASAWFALRSKTSGQFIHERFNRLVIPCIVGFILLSPPEAYFLALAHSLYHGSFFAFYLHFFGSIRIEWNPQWLAAYGYHLWFLAFLFAISLINLPVIFYLRREPGQRFIRKLAVLCEKPWRIFLFILPIALIQVALRAPFPGYQGWADFFTWLVFFLYGYILLAARRFQRAIKKQGIVAFFTGLVSFLVILATYFAGFLNAWEGTPSYSVGYMLYHTNLRSNEPIGIANYTLWCRTMLSARTQIGISDQKRHLRQGSGLQVVVVIILCELNAGIVLPAVKEDISLFQIPNWH